VDGQRLNAAPPAAYRMNIRPHLDSELGAQWLAHMTGSAGDVNRPGESGD
jgi:hypothetical protein